MRARRHLPKTEPNDGKQHMQVFIIDVETTGIKAFDAILEIAILEVNLERKFYRPGRYYRRVCHFGFPPESSFAKKYHASLYDECFHADTSTPNHVRDSIIEFFELCGAKDPASRILIGSHISDYKLEALDKIRFLDKPQTIDFESGPKQVGDYGTVIDLHGLKGFFSLTFECKTEDVVKKISESNVEALMPAGHRNRALFDCFIYLQRMNEYRFYFLSPWGFPDA